jgi:hypothetical protein
MDKEEIQEKLNSEVNELDLSRDEDLSVGLMNLISLEEHLFFTHEKTGNEKHLEMLSEIRRIRTESMEEIVNDTEGEEWCISKHLLSASMRFRETGDKMLDRDREKAKQFYDKAFSLYSMFWAINFDMDENQELIQDLDKRKDGGSDDREIKSGKDTGKENLTPETAENEDSSWLNNVKNTVKKAVDCCKEI